MAKYSNQKCVKEGMQFDSIRELLRWEDLRMMERARAISDLKRQVKYELIPSQKGERSVSYVADFVYTDENGEQVVEDAKGMRTRDYIIKRKLMLWVHGIRIREV